MRSKLIRYILLILFILTSKTICQSLLDEYNVLSIHNRLRFGNHLYNEKDYLRAIDEFQFYLQNKNNDTIRFKMADCFHKIDRLDEASDNYKGLFYNSSLMAESRLAYIKARFDERDYQNFRILVDERNTFSDKYSDEINRLYNVTYLLDKTYFPEKTGYISVFPKNYKNEIENFYNRKLYPEYKSPTKAAILSAIIPGAGKFYTGNTGDGITSLLFTGVLSYLAYRNFDHNHDTRAWIFAGFAGYFYAGNIYGSAAAAHIYNAEVNINYKTDLEQFLKQVNFFLPEFDFLK